MEKKCFYLGISPELIENHQVQQHEKLAQLCKKLHSEGVKIIPLAKKAIHHYLPTYGYIGKDENDFPPQLNPILPKLSIEQLEQPAIFENFLIQLFTLIDYQEHVYHSLNKGALVKFHSRYKYLLMAYSQVVYRELGRYLSDIPQAISDKNMSLEKFALEYQQKLMQALSIPASREGHTNALMHMAGYFKRVLNKEQKQALAQVILQYRQSAIPLCVPIQSLKYWLTTYPDDYLKHQRYFSPYPLCFEGIREKL